MVEHDMRDMIEEWMGECLDIEQLAKTYAAIVNEANTQLTYMSEQLAKQLKEEN